MYQFAIENKVFLVDYVGLIRYFVKNELPVVVRRPLVTTVLKWVHDSDLTGHYTLRKTLARPMPKY